MPENRKLDEVELTPADLKKMINENREAELSPEEFAKVIKKRRVDDPETAEKIIQREELFDDMNAALAERYYQMAFDIARELMNTCYSDYRHDIDNCIEICAQQGVVEALIYKANLYTVKSVFKGTQPEAFPYLKKLADMGYIKSFQWLADCYYYGIGCDTDKELAQKYYFEGLLFDKSWYCSSRYEKMHPELENYDGDNLLIKLVKELVCSEKGLDSRARMRIAELILDGQVKEYAPESAYVILKSEDDDLNELAGYRLGECVLYGIGTKADPFVAEYLLDDAVNELKWLAEDPFDDTLEVKQETFYEFEELVQMREKAEELLQTAKEQYKKMSYEEKIELYGYRSPDDYFFDVWKEEKAEFIKRRG